MSRPQNVAPEFQVYASKVGAVPLSDYSDAILAQSQLQFYECAAAVLVELCHCVDQGRLWLIEIAPEPDAVGQTPQVRWTDEAFVRACTQRAARAWPIQRVNAHKELADLLTILVQASMDYQDTAKNATFPVSARPARDPAFGTRVIRGVAVPLVDAVSTPEHAIELAIVDKAATVSPPPAVSTAAPVATTDAASDAASVHLASHLHPSVVAQFIQSLMTVSVSYVDAVASTFEWAFVDLVPRAPGMLSCANGVRRELGTPCTYDVYRRALPLCESALVTVASTLAMKTQLVDAQLRAMSMLLSRCLGAHAEQSTQTPANRMPRSHIIDPLRHALLPVHFATQSPGALYHTVVNIALMGAANAPSLPKHAQPVRLNASNPDATSTHLSGSRERVYEKRHNKKLPPRNAQQAPSPAQQ